MDIFTKGSDMVKNNASMFLCIIIVLIVIIIGLIIYYRGFMSFGPYVKQIDLQSKHSAHSTHKNVDILIKKINDLN